MNKVSRRKSLQSLASLFMLGAATGTIGYIKRDEIAEWLPAKRRPDWANSLMILTKVHPDGITKGQASAMNSTKIKLLCDLLEISYIKVNLSDDLMMKDRKYGEMRDILESFGPYSVLTVSKHGVVKTHKAPDSVEGMEFIVAEVNQ